VRDLGSKVGHSLAEVAGVRRDSSGLWRDSIWSAKRLPSGSVSVEVGACSALTVSFTEATVMTSPSPIDLVPSIRRPPTNVPFLLPRSSIVAWAAAILISA
jgi:hypothetical protein